MDDTEKGYQCCSNCPPLDYVSNAYAETLHTMVNDEWLPWLKECVGPLREDDIQQWHNEMWTEVVQLYQDDRLGKAMGIMRRTLMRMLRHAPGGDLYQEGNPDLPISAEWQWVFMKEETAKRQDARTRELLERLRELGWDGRA